MAKNLPSTKVSGLKPFNFYCIEVVFGQHAFKGQIKQSIDYIEHQVSI